MLLFVGCTSPQPARPGPAIGIRWSPTENFRPGARTAADVDAIVIHTTEGPYDPGLSFAENQARAFEWAQDVFRSKEREVSAHFVVSGAGEIVQMVRVEDVAWTTTYYNDRSIGIECAGWADRPETWTPELLHALERLVARLSVEWGVPAEHPEGDAVRGPLGPYAKRGFQGFDAPGIVGHVQVQTAGSEAVRLGKLNTKTDPGQYFPWESFVADVRAAIRSSND